MWRTIVELIISIFLVLVLGMTCSINASPSVLWLTTYIVLFIYYAYRSYKIFNNNKEIKQEIESDIVYRDSKFDINTVFIPPLAYVVLFGLICQQFYLFDNTFFVVGSKEISFTYKEFSWLVFAFDNLVRAAFFDFLETFNIHISNISSSNIFILCFVFFFKSLASVCFVLYIYRTFFTTMQYLKK